MNENAINAINAIRHDLLNADWNSIEDSEDVNFMYITFIEKLLETYNANCVQSLSRN